MVWENENPIRIWLTWVTIFTATCSPSSFFYRATEKTLLFFLPCRHEESSLTVKERDCLLAEPWQPNHRSQLEDKGSTWVDEVTASTIERYIGQLRPSWSSWRSLYLRTLAPATGPCIEMRLIITADMCWGPWWRHNHPRGSKCEVFLHQLPTRNVCELFFFQFFSISQSRYATSDRAESVSVCTRSTETLKNVLPVPINAELCRVEGCKKWMCMWENL